MKVSGKSEMVCCFFNVRLLWIWGVKQFYSKIRCGSILYEKKIGIYMVKKYKETYHGFMTLG